MQAPRQHRHFAHSGKSEDGSDCQALPEHLEGTAVRAAAGEGPGLPLCAGTAGRFHDFGKYDPTFQRRLRGDPAAVDHSTAGANFLLGRAGATPHAAELLAYAILDHHAGLPDKTGCEAAMDRRTGQFALRDPVPPAVRAAQQVDLAPLRLRHTARPGLHAVGHRPRRPSLLFRAFLRAGVLEVPPPAARRSGDELARRARPRLRPPAG